MTLTYKPITAEELLLMPDGGLRRELVEGEVRETNPARYVHGRIAMNVSIPLDQYARRHELGIVFAAETGFEIANDPDTVRAPDDVLG